MNRTTLYDNLFQLIDPSVVVLTPNRRLAATLHKLYQAQQIATGTAVWLTPDILPITSWQQRLWQDYLSITTDTLPLILNPAQEKLLWEEIIVQSKRYETLLRTSETADKAHSAYKLLKQWRISLGSKTFPEILSLFQSTEDYSALLNWVEDFEALCLKQHWSSNAGLPDLLIEQIANQTILLPKKILLVGFTDLPPQTHCLMQACKTLGCEVEEFTLTSTPSSIRYLGIAEAEHEIRAMAQWAKQQSQVHPDFYIGCVIPNIETLRDRVEQIFSETFAEKNTLHSHAGSFNITAGKPLQHYPAIHSALLLLNLYKKNISLETFAHFLFSPFLGEAESERLKRAKFDRTLRQANISKINLQRLLADEQNKFVSLTSQCPQLAKRFKEFLITFNQLEKEMTYQAWAKVFNKLLTVLGWPGERSLNSEEFQVVESWLNVFETFISLDAVNPPISFHKALQTLTKLTSSTVFQPKTPDAPIQVMGLLEAGGLPFDCLWVSGMDDVSWPPQPNPNPFLPRRLQRELQMPHASAERELHFCKSLMQQFSQCATDIIYSYAEKNDDLELQPSALLREFSEVDLDALKLSVAIKPSEMIYHSKNIEWIEDEVAPAVKENEMIRGGIAVIQHQAACPFKAFARWRLFAQELETTVPGLRAKDRGTIIHKIMELIWNQLGNHENLLSLEETTLRDLIKTQVQAALILTPASHSDFKQYLNLEKIRLEKLIYDWLQQEKLRTPFKVITHEKRVEYVIGQLNLNFRIDRIDQLEDGNQFIIDYKTGKYNEVNDWFSERPEQPQLPLYALLDPIQTVGIAFAQIYTGAHGFKGISRYAIEMKGVKLISEMKKTHALSWDQQLTQWQTILLKLSTDFSLGLAKVDPKEAEQTCQWCALKSLCRISEDHAAATIN